jgi:dethiobiotin synthetase
VRGYFVTGTDTGVGKTFVTAALARRARELGQKVFAFKPIETGCEAVEGVLVGADQQILVAAAGDWQRGALAGCYRFRLPAAPLVAAEAEGAAIQMSQVQAALDAGTVQADLVLVEGAGGWRVPVTVTEDMAGLAALCALPVLVVARAGLGTINHTLLTVEAIERDGLRVAAVVLSRRPDEDEGFAGSNARQISRAWRGTVHVFDGQDDLLRALG